MDFSNSSRFEQEKQAYWRMRGDLLSRYPAKWVAIVGGQVVAVGEKKMAVLKQAFDLTRSEVGYITCVGQEENVGKKRVRNIVTGKYDQRYVPPIPMVTASILEPRNNLTKSVDFIVDTGADLTVLRDEIADDLGLWNNQWEEAEISGVGSQPERRVLYLTTVQMNGQEFPVTVDCRNDLNEDILGRDVVNEFELTLNAKRELVHFEYVPDLSQ